MDALATIKVAEDVLAVALQEGMNANLDYKSVFKSGKKSVQQLAKLLGINGGSAK